MQNDSLFLYNFAPTYCLFILGMIKGFKYVPIWLHVAILSTK